MKKVFLTVLVSLVVSLLAAQISRAETITLVTDQRFTKFTAGELSDLLAAIPRSWGVEFTTFDTLAQTKDGIVLFKLVNRSVLYGVRVYKNGKRVFEPILSLSIPDAIKKLKMAISRTTASN